MNRGPPERGESLGKDLSMSNMVKARVSIKGTRPIFWHAFGPDALPLTPQEKAGVAGNDPTEWQRSVLATKEGQLFVRGDYLFSCLREGAKYTKKGRGSIMLALAATLLMEDDRVLFDRYLPE